MTSLRQRVLNELQRRNYSAETTRGYIHAIRQFAEFFGKSPETLGAEEIRQFQLHLLKEKETRPWHCRGAHVGATFSLQEDLEAPGHRIR